jgi:hypothetical protein
MAKYQAIVKVASDKQIFGQILILIAATMITKMFGIVIAELQHVKYLNKKSN